MQEFNVILRKIRYADMIVEAKDEKEAGELAMNKYMEGLVDWGDEDVEVEETEEI